LKMDAQGRPKCVACFMCATACPAECISIVAQPAPWPDRDKVPAKFEIDLLKCIYCGMCEEACPCDAIELTQKFTQVSTSRAEKVHGIERLLREK
jgi:NADH-quinone oxidoreductase subunit I